MPDRLASEMERELTRLAALCRGLRAIERALTATLGLTNRSSVAA
jgi:hypothetical protein